jgi:hypothetical protein
LGKITPPLAVPYMRGAAFHSLQAFLTQFYKIADNS